MPESFINLLDKECLFMIEISKRFNIELKKLIYTVKKVTEDADLMAKYTCITDEVASRLNSDEYTVSSGKSKSQEASSGMVEEISSNSTTPLKRTLEFHDDDMEQSAVKTLKTTN